MSAPSSTVPRPGDGTERSPSPAPSIDAARLDALHRYGVLANGPDGVFDEIVELAALLCGTPLALVSLVDEGRRWSRARLGVDVPATGRDLSFCAHVLGQRSVLVVPDTTLDPRFADDPDVAGGAGHRFYAGAPLIAPDGQALGAVCVLDTVPRELTARQVRGLELLAGQVITLLEHRRAAHGLAAEVEARAAAEAAHARTRRVLDGLLENSDVPIYAKSLDGRFLMANTAVHRMFGKRPGEVVGRTDADLTRAEEAERFAVNDRAVAAGGTRRLMSETVTHADGSVHSYLSMKFPLRDAVGEVFAVAGMSTDVTEITAARADLVASERRWSALVQNSPVAIAIVGRDDLQFRYANASAAALYGVADADELLGCSFPALFPSEEVDAFHRWTSRLEQEETVDGELTRMIGFDGVERHVEVHASTVSWDSHRAIQVEMRDVTARVVSANALRTGEQRFRALVTGAPVGIVECLPDTTVVSVNPRLCAMLGHTPEELVGRSWTMVLHPSEHAAARADWDGLLHPGTTTTTDAERTFLRRDGSPMPVILSLAGVDDGDGTVARMMLTVIDVTDQRRTERALQASEQLFRKAFSAAPMGLVVLAWPTGGPAVPVQVNPAACSILDRTAEEITRAGLAAIIDPQDAPRLRQALQRLLSGAVESIRVDLRFLRPDGSTVWTVLSATIVPASGDDGRRIVTLIEDTTAQHDAEGALEQLVHAGQDLPQAWRAVARMAVPALADVAFVQSVGEHGGLQTQHVLHRDPARQSDAHALVAAFGRRLTDPSGPGRVASTGIPEVVLDAGGPGGDLTPDQAATRARLGVTGSICAPLRARGELIGVLTLVRTSSGPFAPTDVARAQQMCARAALPLDNALAHSRHRLSSLALQQALLPDLRHQPAHLRLASRYLPAGAGVGQMTGGDWYDAFTDQQGTTALVIGDVAGHDIAAAAAMGQLRSMLRMAGHDGRLGPAGILTAVDTATDGLGTSVFATSLVAHVRAAPALSRSGSDTGRLAVTWSSAGHPPPVVLRADGTVERDQRRPDHALGLDMSRSAAVQRVNRSVALGPGDTLLLYTDGLIERRDADLEEGTQRLVDALRSVAGLALEDLCDAVVELMQPDGTDDVTLFAVQSTDDGRGVLDVPGRTSS